MKTKQTKEVAKKRSVKTWKFPSNLMYVGGTEYDYDRSYPCDDGCVNDYCRCGRIDNVRVKVDFHNLAIGIAIPMENVLLEINEANKLKRKIEKNSMFFAYCIDRVLRIKKADNPDLWDGEVSGGYYGQELDGISFSDYDTISLIHQLYQYSPQQKIIEVLKLEYGHLLPQLEGMKWTLMEDVDIKDLIVPNVEYMKKVDSTIYPDMNEYELPIGIYTDAGNGKFKLVDGYHRLISAQRATKKKKFSIIVGKKK